MSAYKGQCLCGVIRYSVDKISQKMANCHCSMCRKFHGAAFATYGEVDKNKFHWLSGKKFLKTYLASNGTKRQFCEKCGSSLIFIPNKDKGRVVEFALGTLDSKIKNEPDVHVFTDFKANWYQISDDLPQFKKGRV